MEEKKNIELQDLETGPDTTENIHEVVDDPSPGMAESAAPQNYTVKNAGDWEEWRREHQDVLQDEQPRVRHTIGYLEPDQTKMLQESAFNYDTLLKKMQDTHARKNSDYGDAAYKGYKKYGDYYFLVQLNNKLSRLESLTIGNTKQQVMDESIDDTLMDMANYAIMYLESRHRHD